VSRLNTIPEFTEDPRSMATTLRAMKEILESLAGLRPGPGLGVPNVFVQAQAPQGQAASIKPGDLWIGRGASALNYWDGRLWRPVTLAESFRTRFFHSSSAGAAPVEQGGITGVFTQTMAVTGSDVTVPVSVDGTLGSPALFASLESCQIQYSVLRDTADNNAAPWAHLREVGPNFIRLRVKRSNVVGGTFATRYEGSVDNAAAATLRVSVTGILGGAV
jgi:hypothetical protein